MTKDSLTLNALFNMFYDNEMQNAPAASRALESDRHRSRAASSIHAPVHASAAPALAGIYRPPVTRSEHREPPRDPCDTDTPPASRASDQRSGSCAQLYVQTPPTPRAQLAHWLLEPDVMKTGSAIREFNWERLQ